MEVRYEQPERFMRYNAEIEAYNRAARETMARLGVPVNDLYAAARALPESAWSDPTHLYTPLGTQTLGDAVVRAIRAHF